MNSIMSENFSFDNQGVQDIASLLGTSDSSTLKIIEEGEYLNSIKRKLMDYASSKYALNNAGFKSQGNFSPSESNHPEFNELFAKHQDNYKTCKAKIGDLRGEIYKLLAHKQSYNTTLTQFDTELAGLNKKLKKVNFKINLNNKNLNHDLDQTRQKIKDTEDALRQKEIIKNDM